MNAEGKKFEAAKRKGGKSENSKRSETLTDSKGKQKVHTAHIVQLAQLQALNYLRNT